VELEGVVPVAEPAAEVDEARIDDGTAQSVEEGRRQVLVEGADVAREVRGVDDGVFQAVPTPQRGRRGLEAEAGEEVVACPVVPGARSGDEAVREGQGVDVEPGAGLGVEGAVAQRGGAGEEGVEDLARGNGR
jgi:hypothetical protein